jgi:hypothetical protein
MVTRISTALDDDEYFSSASEFRVQSSYYHLCNLRNLWMFFGLFASQLSKAKAIAKLGIRNQKPQTSTDCPDYADDNKQKIR